MLGTKVTWPSESVSGWLWESCFKIPKISRPNDSTLLGTNKYSYNVYIVYIPYQPALLSRWCSFSRLVRYVIWMLLSVLLHGCDFPLNVGDENSFFEKELFQWFPLPERIPPPTSIRAWHLVLKVPFFTDFLFCETKILCDRIPICS